MKILSKISLAALMVVLVTPTFAYAREGEPNDDSTIRASMQASTSVKTKLPLPGEKIRDLKEKFDERRENKAASSTVASTTRGEMGKTAKERFAKFMDQLGKRFDAAIERLDKITLRIESRIAKIEAAGGNTTEVKAKLADAKAKIEIARTSVTEAKKQAQATTTLSNIQALYPAIKEGFDTAKENIKTAQSSLIDVVSQLGRIKVKINATTTATSSIDN